MEGLQSYNRCARKDHICDYCGRLIKKGDAYRYSKNIDGGRIYDWKAHLDCETAASDLWDFIDPDDGMSGDDFQSGCQEFCHVFICPECKYMDEKRGECLLDKPFCVDKIAQLFDEYELVRNWEGFRVTWKLRKIKAEAEG